VTTPGQIVTPDSGTGGDSGGAEAPSTPQSGSGG
jgi:penicillin-binding protein 2A